PVKEYTHFEAGLCLLGAVRPDEAVALLKERVHRVEEATRQLRAALDHVLGTGLPRLYLVEVEYRLSQLEAEGAFLPSRPRRIETERWDTSPVWWYLHGDRGEEAGIEEPGAKDQEGKRGG